MRDQGKRESHKQIYIGSLLHQKLHPVPRNHWVYHYAIKTRLQTPHTKVMTLIPSRNTLPLANHTKSVDFEPLKNTQHSLTTQIQKYKKGIEYTQVLQSLKFKITTQSYSTHLRMIQSSFKSWKIVLINYFSYSKIMRKTTFIQTNQVVKSI